MAFEERLRVPIWWWAVVVLLVLSLAVAVFAYVSPELGGFVVGAFTVALVALVISYGRARIVVEQNTLVIGRNRIEGRWIGGAEALTGKAAADAMGAGGHPSDYLQTRPYVADLVRVRISDPADPHPHWVISSRRAEELAAAVNAISGETA